VGPRAAGRRRETGRRPPHPKPAPAPAHSQRKCSACRTRFRRCTDLPSCCHVYTRNTLAPCMSCVRTSAVRAASPAHRPSPRPALCALTSRSLSRALCSSPPRSSLQRPPALPPPRRTRPHSRVTVDPNQMSSSFSLCVYRQLNSNAPTSRAPQLTPSSPNPSRTGRLWLG
jgi:hypothetical protein